MHDYEHIIDKRIVRMQRMDTNSDYDVSRPNAILIGIEDIADKLIISVRNDGLSIDIRFSTEPEIEDDYGLKYFEQSLNDLKPDDRLSIFLGNKIVAIEAAEFLQPKIEGDDFLILTKGYAGVRIKTEAHEFLFHNQFGGRIDIDDKNASIPNPQSWQWIE